MLLYLLILRSNGSIGHGNKGLGGPPASLSLNNRRMGMRELNIVSQAGEQQNGEHSSVIINIRYRERVSDIMKVGSNSDEDNNDGTVDKE